MMKTCSDVGRSFLEGSIDFQQILVLSKSEKAWWHDKKRQGTNALLMLGWLITAVKDGDSLLLPLVITGRSAGISV